MVPSRLIHGGVDVIADVELFGPGISRENVMIGIRLKSSLSDPEFPPFTNWLTWVGQLLRWMRGVVDLVKVGCEGSGKAGVGKYKLSRNIRSSCEILTHSRIPLIRLPKGQRPQIEVYSRVSDIRLIPLDVFPFEISSFIGSGEDVPRRSDKSQ